MSFRQVERRVSEKPPPLYVWATISVAAQSVPCIEAWLGQKTQITRELALHSKLQQTRDQWVSLRCRDIKTCDTLQLSMEHVNEKQAWSQTAKFSLAPKSLHQNTCCLQGFQNTRLWLLQDCISRHLIKTFQETTDRFWSKNKTKMERKQWNWLSKKISNAGLSSLHAFIGVGPIITIIKKESQDQLCSVGGCETNVLGKKEKKGTWKFTSSERGTKAHCWKRSITLQEAKQMPASHNTEQTCGYLRLFSSSNSGKKGRTRSFSQALYLQKGRARSRGVASKGASRVTIRWIRRRQKTCCL